MTLYVKTPEANEPLDTYCKKLSKKNNAILYKLESYIGKPLLSDEQLAEIRDIILTVSADIGRINQFISESDKHERLQ